MYAKWISHTVFILLLACNNQPTANSYRQKAAPRNVKLDIGQSKPSDDWEYGFIKEESAKLGLNAMVGGHDSLHMRVWLGHSLAITTHIVDIEFTNNQWKARLITNTLLNPGKKGNDVPQYKKKIKHVEPVTGWKYFVGDIEEMLNLPQAYDSSGCNRTGLDGITYYFEISTKEKYRFYYYENPENACDCSAAYTVLRFATTLEREFDFHYTR